jgi:hypothetical protein
VWPVYMADNLTAICELIVWTSEILVISQPHRPPRFVTETALLLFCLVFIVCNVSIIDCVALCAVFCSCVVLFCVISVFLCYVLL